VEPLLPWQVAEACAPSLLAPTRLEPVHPPSAAAVQSLRETAELVPPGTAARAAPSVWVLQPVPRH
jgi:hypothetical protein